jgi:hypothetical protein
MNFVQTYIIFYCSLIGYFCEFVMFVCQTGEANLKGNQSMSNISSIPSALPTQFNLPPSPTKQTNDGDHDNDKFESAADKKTEASQPGALNIIA